MISDSSAVIIAAMISAVAVIIPCIIKLVPARAPQGSQPNRLLPAKWDSSRLDDLHEEVRANKEDLDRTKENIHKIEIQLTEMKVTMTEGFRQITDLLKSR